MAAPSAISAVPVIDLSDLHDRKHDISKQLLQAAEEIGFFHVTGHGFGQHEIDAAFATSVKYANLPDAVRAQHVKDKSDNVYILGWTERRVSAGRLLHQMLMAFDEQRMEGIWPTEDECRGFKQVMLNFMYKAARVTDDIMTCLATGLGLPEDYYKEPMDPDAPDNMTAFSSNCYPSWEQKKYAESTLRRIAHTDFEVLTLLFQRQGETGLEVCAGKDTTAGEAMRSGLWVHCDPVPGAITVNIGDALQYWTDGRLKSTFHRVRMPRQNEYQGDRYSLAYFANARASTLFQGPKKLYPPISFAQILEQKNSHQKSFTKREGMTDEEYIKFQKSNAIGPEFQMVLNAAVKATV